MMVTQYTKTIAVAIATAIVFFTGVFVGKFYAEQPETVTFMSQFEAAETSGVMHAADRAQVPMSRSQAEEAAQQICKSVTRKPDTKVVTTGAQLASTVEQQRKVAKADFSIVTPAAVSLTPEQGQKPIELKMPEIKSDTSVTLNQYNIKAYPKILASVQYYVRDIYSASVSTQVKVPRVPLLLPKGEVVWAGASILKYRQENHIGVSVTIPLGG